MDDANKAGIFTTGFAIGAAVGAIIMLLYAPEPGWATKGIIRRKARVIARLLGW